VVAGEADQRGRSRPGDQSALEEAAAIARRGVGHGLVTIGRASVFVHSHGQRFLLEIRVSRREGGGA
jgi:hypothetical protein